MPTEIKVSDAKGNVLYEKIIDNSDLDNTDLISKIFFHPKITFEDEPMNGGKGSLNLPYEYEDKSERRYK